MKNFLLKEMTLKWHVVWAVTCVTAYIILVASGYLEHHVTWPYQQIIALVVGGVVAGASTRLWHPF
jgi:hypothetical protein